MFMLLAEAAQTQPTTWPDVVMFAIGAIITLGVAYLVFR